MTTLANLHHVSRDMLVVLAREPLSEDALLDEMEDYTGARQYGKYVSLLGDLRDAGYIVRARPSHQKTVYMLTQRGRQALENRREWENRLLN